MAEVFVKTPGGKSLRVEIEDDDERPYTFRELKCLLHAKFPKDVGDPDLIVLTFAGEECRDAATTKDVDISEASVIFLMHRTPPAPVVKAATFAKGEAVEVWSNSANAWTKATVADIFLTDTLVGKYTIKAGTTKVIYDGNGLEKYIPRELEKTIRKAATFAKGEAVEVWSDSANAWTKATVADIFLTDTQVGKYTAKAGTTKVIYAGSEKYIPRELEKTIRKAGAANAEASSYIQVEPQAPVETAKERMARTESEVSKARKEAPRAAGTAPEESLDKLKVEELKKRCREAGLKVGGNKAELIARLQAQPVPDSVAGPPAVEPAKERKARVEPEVSEARIEAPLAAGTAPKANKLSPGATVQVEGTQLGDRNGKLGVLKSFNKESQRWLVRFGDGQENQIRPECLTVELEEEYAREDAAQAAADAKQQAAKASPRSSASQVHPEDWSTTHGAETNQPRGTSMCNLVSDRSGREPLLEEGRAAQRDSQSNPVSLPSVARHEEPASRNCYERVMALMMGCHEWVRARLRTRQEQRRTDSFRLSDGESVPDFEIEYTNRLNSTLISSTNADPRSLRRQSGVAVRDNRRMKDAITTAAARRMSNAIHTTRFTPLTWLPLSLWAQFRRVANIYFAIVAILAMSPWVTASHSKTAVVAVVFLLQAVKDLYEDWKLRRDDWTENSRTCSIFMSERGAFSSHQAQDCPKWCDVQVGSVVAVHNGELIPADLLIVATSDESGIAFVSTKSLDGETNLKQRCVPNGAEHVKICPTDTDVLTKLKGANLKISMQKPNKELLEMPNRISFGTSGPRQVIDLENFALRGCELQNTAWIIGIACYVGEATKVRLNSSRPKLKRSDLEIKLNNCVRYILIGIVVLSVLFSLFGKLLGLFNFPDNRELSWHKVLVRYLVMLWAVLPVTLYILFEFMHLAFGVMIDQDEKMKSPITGDLASARNTTSIEDLGQVKFVFSDKTGTLTTNEMRFAYCYVGTETIGPFLQNGQAEELPPGTQMVRKMLQERHKPMTEFFLMLAVCHSVKTDEHGTYQAESPDELALVEAAKSVGVTWVSSKRSGQGKLSIVSHEAPTERKEWQEDKQETHLVAYELPFSSDRKRMTVIISKEGGSALIMTKGADSVMQDLLDHGIPEAAVKAIDDFARRGLRTLVFGQRTMDKTSYETWRHAFEQANRNMVDRAGALEAVYRKAEKHLTFVGVSALEDRLQDQVPDTIEDLRSVGIRVWVLTGDKVQTAIEIARACRLIDANMQMCEILGNDNVLDKLKEENATDRGDQPRAIVLDGCSVASILPEEAARVELYKLAEKCESCVCCRLSPLQKRELVRLVRKQNKEAITLAIGDGANDVPMILGAHVGIGIRGKEGGAAVQASDIAISEFRFLRNLLFVHGRKAYRRTATFLGYFMYKSIALGWPYFIHAIFANFHGTNPFSPTVDSIYAPVTSWSVALILTFDMDEDLDKYIDDRTDSARMETAYKFGSNREGLNAGVFKRWMCFASLHGIVSWLVPMLCATGKITEKHQNLGFWEASLGAFTTLLITVHLKLFLVGNWEFGCPTRWHGETEASDSHVNNKKLGWLGGFAWAGELLAYVVGVLAVGCIVGSHGFSPNPFAPECVSCYGNGTKTECVSEACPANANVPAHVFKWRLILPILITPCALFACDWYLMIRFEYAADTQHRGRESRISRAMISRGIIDP